MWEVLVKQYKNRVKKGFAYIDIKWKSNIHSGAEYSTVDNIINDTSNHLIKILGEAGCGKTTIMKQLEYLSAQRYLKKQSLAIPVFISLADIEVDSSLHADLNNSICKRLDIGPDILKNLFSSNTIVLYLDGFNEILDIRIKKQIAWSIDNLTLQYPEVNVFLSDRSLVRSYIETMRSALVYKLYPLDNLLKELFIEKNCNDAEAKEMILSYFRNNPNYYAILDTPIKIIQYIEYVTSQRCIPENFEKEYIHFLFERELTAKKDENADYLEDFACTLAVSSDSGIPIKVACSYIAKCKRVLGYTAPDSLKCLNLLIEMGILTNEEGIIDFKFPSFRDYFWMSAFESHLVDLLGENE